MSQIGKWADNFSVLIDKLAIRLYDFFPFSLMILAIERGLTFDFNKIDPVKRMCVFGEVLWIVSLLAQSGGDSSWTSR
jgi:hypothetical protein